MPGEAELRLRERLSKLKSRPAARARCSGELEKLERQLDASSRSRPTRTSGGPSSSRGTRIAVHAGLRRALFGDVFELHGDRVRARRRGDRRRPRQARRPHVAFVGHQKGRDLKERTRRNFGMAYPEGYRKAMRTMELADRFGFPLVTFVDTPGAYPGSRRSSTARAARSRARRRDAAAAASRRSPA
jgi:acetyl-CoA carboxylase alpha subunit